jgi:hypothetical protein
MHNFTENAAGVSARIVLGALLFPLPTFISCMLFSLGRMMHQVGYADPSEKGGFSSGVRRYMLFQMLLGDTAQNGFVLYGALKALEIWE